MSSVASCALAIAAAIETPEPESVVVSRGMVFALGPGVHPKAPAFRQAATACGVRPPSAQPG